MPNEIKAPMRNEMDKPVGQIATDQESRFYEVMSVSPRTATELAALTGSSEQSVRGWLAVQVARGYLVHDDATGYYANWCSWPRS